MRLEWWCAGEAGGILTPIYRYISRHITNAGLSFESSCINIRSCSTTDQVTKLYYELTGHRNLGN